MTPVNSGHLIWWLRKQCAADIAVAGEAASTSTRREWSDEFVTPEGYGVDQSSIHVARHDPASVLADVAAKGRIVDRCESVLGASDAYDFAPLRSFALTMLRELATGYAGRDGFDEGWRTT